MSMEILEKRPRLEANTNGLVKNFASPTPVLRKELVEDVPLRPAYIGILKSRKDIAVAIRSVTSILPAYGHLKRCVGQRLLLAFVKWSDKDERDDRFETAEDLKNFLIDKKFDMNILKDTFEIVRVPEKPPKTRAQYNKALEAWPVNFHPDSTIEIIVTGNFFDSQQLDTINACMRICINAAKAKAVGNDSCNGAALILDPDDGNNSRVLAIAASRINEHPMWHASMLAVDLVARIRGGGAWELDAPFIIEQSEVERKCELTNEQLPLFYPAALKSINIPDTIFPSVLKTKLSEEERKAPYLCTGYWIFLLKEPCPLCAMALLHSRAAMIFYGTGNPVKGVLGTRAVFHTTPGLNHRYKVWRNVLESECRAVAANLSVI
uniref:CMP/dCMP-type deaminase domain-containing protein n=1 Tax=Bracon brevicornis TaxID=1563983 RepID=A0A6V7M3V9_9HYME